MRRHRRNLSLIEMDAAANDRDECFVIINCAAHLQRLLLKFPVLNCETLEMILWTLGPDSREAVDYLMRQMNDREMEEHGEDLTDAPSNPDNVARAMFSVLKRLGKAKIGKFFNLIRTILERRTHSLAYRGKSEAEKKLDRLKKMFGLTQQEQDFCTFLYITTLWSKPADYFNSHLDCYSIAGRKYITTSLDISNQDLRRVLEGTLSKIEMFIISDYSLELTDEFKEFFRKSSSNWLSKHLFKKVTRKAIPLESHLIEARQTDHVLSLLKSRRNEPVHILLYGPAGTGKTSYALGIAGRLGIEAFEILREQENRSCNRRAAIIACMKMTDTGGEKPLIIVDEADNLLNTRLSWFMSGETQDKGWLNQLMEEPGARMIWITNETGMIDESVRRRFAFSLPFRAFNRPQRMQMTESVLKQNGVMKQYSVEEIAALVKEYPVSGGILDMAVKKARLTCRPGNARFKEAVTMGLDAFRQLERGGRKPQRREHIETSYSLEGLNTEGDLQSLMDQISAFDSYLQENKDAVRNFNLLFYGPPGTGKSEMARYIAECLERPLIVKRLSDILNCYVGMTEQHIAMAFQEAEEQDAVLVIDEADSVLFSRDRAQHSWEASFTNEFLTQMERFRGILICTTNRLTDLDSASIRRFNHKLGFRYLNPAGNLIFYWKMLSGLTTEPIGKSVEEELKSLTDLAPGDFRVVRDRFFIYTPDKVNHRMMVDALKGESTIKRAQQGRKHIGF